MEHFELIIFGITSNLAQIKLLPALYDIAEKGRLPQNTSIIGTARQPKNRQELEKYLYDVLHQENRHHQHEIKDEVFQRLCQALHFVDGDIEDPNFYPKLKNYLDSLDSGGESRVNRIFYLATYPKLYRFIFENMDRNGLNKQHRGWVRVMIEKPIGQDLESAKELNRLLLAYFGEDQIYRLDHYLGKETLQNMLAFRFGNGIFEPLMNKDYIDHIQVTAAEDFGIGLRGGYYDKVGALKDVGQNHLLQMAAFATMDAPAQFTNKAVTAERIKILQSLVPDPAKVVFGQYQGYDKEKSVEPNSKTDTFFALRAEIKNERFAGVPIYMRAGKKLPQTVTEVAIIFKTPKNRLFRHLECGMEPNALIFRIQPNEGIVLKILVKKPGHEIELEPNYMQFCYKGLKNDIPDPYEHLISDTIVGDQTFFNDAEEIEAQWTFIDPLVKSKKDPIVYSTGSWGPKEADEVITTDGRCWLEPSMDFCSF